MRKLLFILIFFLVFIIQFELVNASLANRQRYYRWEIITETDEITQEYSSTGSGYINMGAMETTQEEIPEEIPQIVPFSEKIASMLKFEVPPFPTLFFIVFDYLLAILLIIMFAIMITMIIEHL